MLGIDLAVSRHFGGTPYSWTSLSYLSYHQCTNQLTNYLPYELWLVDVHRLLEAVLTPTPTPTKTDRAVAAGVVDLGLVGRLELLA